MGLAVAGPPSSFALLQTALSLALLARYFRFGDFSDVPAAVTAAAIGAALTVALLGALAIAGVRAVLARLSGRPEAAERAAALLVGAELGYLLLDHPVYALTRLHLDLRIAQMLWQPSAMAAIGLRGTDAALALLLLALGMALGWGVRAAARRLPPPPPRAARVAAACALVFVLAERAAAAVLAPTFLSERNDPGALLPFARWVSFEAPEDLAFALTGRAGIYGRSSTAPGAEPVGRGAWTYPTAAARAYQPPAQRRPNILLIAVESLRADLVEERAMPQLTALARRSTVAELHLSSGNATHLGLFSLLTGLSARNWAAFNELAGVPFTYELLQRAGYHVTATSAHLPSWFGLDRHVLHRRWELGRYPGEDADQALTDDLIAYLRDPRQPFFAFAFYDGTHYPYFVHPDQAPFTPYAGTFSLADPELQSRRPELWNRYRNAIHRVDHQLGRLLRALAEAGLEEDTVVVVTGDHGESFWEDERFTHTSLLSRVQLQVPLILRVPGRAPGALPFPTGHADVMPTLLALAGFGLPADEWSDGSPLLEGPPLPPLALQMDVEEPSHYAVATGGALARFVLRRGKLRWEGAEALGSPHPGGLPGFSEVLPELLRRLAHDSRWQRRAAAGPSP